MLLSISRFVQRKYYDIYHLKKKSFFSSSYPWLPLSDSGLLSVLDFSKLIKPPLHFGLPWPKKTNLKKETRPLPMFSAMRELLQIQDERYVFLW